MDRDTKNPGIYSERYESLRGHRRKYTLINTKQFGKETKKNETTEGNSAELEQKRTYRQ